MLQYLKGRPTFLEVMSNLICLGRIVLCQKQSWWFKLLVHNQVAGFILQVTVEKQFLSLDKIEFWDCGFSLNW